MNKSLNVVPPQKCTRNTNMYDWIEPSGGLYHQRETTLCCINITVRQRVHDHGQKS